MFLIVLKDMECLIDMKLIKLFLILKLRFRIFVPWKGMLRGVK